AYAVVRPSTCSAKVRAGQSATSQKNRRTANRIITRCPPAAASASRREYRLCTRDATAWHRGHGPPAARARAQMHTSPGNGSTRSTPPRVRGGNRASRPHSAPHDKQSPRGDNDPLDAWLTGGRKQPPIYQESLHLPRQHADHGQHSSPRAALVRGTPHRASRDHEMWVRTKDH